jgi:hypothetical protein
MFVSCFSLYRWVSMVHAATPSRCKLLQDSVQARNGTGHRSCTKSGWRKPALRNVARSQMENAFPRRHSRVQPGAVGVSQPWFGTRTCNRDANQCAKTGRCCKRESEPRRADAVTRPHLHTSTGCRKRESEPRRAHARRSCERACRHCKMGISKRTLACIRRRLCTP